MINKADGELIVSSQPCSLALETEEVMEVPLSLLINKRHSQTDALMVETTSLNGVVELGGTITVSF